MKPKIIKEYQEYNIVEELMPGPLDYSGTWEVATNKEGTYIGTPDHAKNLIEKYGLTKLQGTKDCKNHCCIGYNPTEQKWYGWSHRTIFGFGIGSKTKKGDCSYRPTNLEDFIEDCTNFWSDPGHNNVTSKVVENDGTKQIYTEWTYSNDPWEIPNKKLRGGITGVHTDIPEQWGRGEWTAKTMDDAKQMAIDFANGVS